MAGAAQAETDTAHKLRSAIWSQTDSGAQAEAAFKQVDKDRSGAIELEEFDTAAK